MCEAHTPLSLSGEDTYEWCDGHGFYGLPHEVQMIILKCCPLWALARLISVSSRFSALISSVVSAVNTFDFSYGSPENMKETFQLLLHHSAALKTITGAVLVQRYSSKYLKKNARQCTPEQLFALVRRNAGLEHLVLYDHGVTYENYIKDLLNSLQPCEYLRMLYSECFEDSVSAVQDFVAKKEFLVEIAFPNMNGLQATLEMHGWTGLQNSRFGTHSNGRPIQVLRKTGKQPGEQQSPASHIISSVSLSSYFPVFGRQAPTPVKNFRANTGSSLRDSVRRTLPEVASD